MNRSLIAAAALAAFATTASADGHTTGTMSEGFDMLTAALANDFDRIGLSMDADALDGLTLGQIAAIKSIVDSDDSNDGEKKSRIEAIIDQ